MTDEYRDLLDTETILPGDEYESIAGDWYPVVSTHYRTPREVNINNLFHRRFRRPISAKPEPPSEPAPADGQAEKYRVLVDDAVVRFGDVIEWRDGRREMMTFLSTLPTTAAQAKSLFGAARILRKPPEPSIDPGEGYRLMSDHEVLRGTDHHTLNGGWWACYGYIGKTVAEVKKQLLPPHTLFRRRIHEVAEPTLNDLRRAYIHRHPSPDEDMLLSMRYAIVCPDGVRRHAATWDEAVAVLDDAVRRECERKGGQS